jgi:hypothetical protein
VQPIGLRLLKRQRDMGDGVAGMRRVERRTSLDVDQVTVTTSCTTCSDAG